MNILKRIKDAMPAELTAKLNLQNWKDSKLDQTLMSYPQLLEIKPNERYIFHGDYYEVDNSVATVLSFFHTDGASDSFSPFWGICRTPVGLHDDIVTVTFEQIRRMTDGWLFDHQTRAEGIAEMNGNEQMSAGNNTSRVRASSKQRDLQVVANELQNGASYLSASYRILIKAPTLEKLDEAIMAIDRYYIDRFGSMVAAPFVGDQRTELSRLFSKNERKLGKPFYFTSTEFAGSHALVTHGLEDPNGEYVGAMIGDVNTSAIIFDVNKYKHHCVVASEGYHEKLGRVHVADMWGSKISQACLLSGGRVVHLILDGANLDKLGPKFERLSHKINMNSGDVNMFEMFGDVKDELSIFPMQMQKLRLIAEQMYETTDDDRGVILGKLEEIATDFYVAKGMWHHNAKQNRNKLRIVGIKHKDIPKLDEFVMYLDTRYKAMCTSSSKDPKVLSALHMLYLTFKNMLSNNNDLFNTITTDVIDGAKNGRRVVYDFSELMHRGSAIAMSQLVNIVAFAVGNLGKNDTVIIHGTELIDDCIKKYIERQFSQLFNKGGRVCYLYNNIEKMIKDKDFSAFDKTDYTILGNMTETIVDDYQKALGQEIPADLVRCITGKAEMICYIRRAFDNVVFKQDLALGLSKLKGSSPR